MIMHYIAKASSLERLGDGLRFCWYTEKGELGHIPTLQTLATHPSPHPSPFLSFPSMALHGNAHLGLDIGKVELSLRIIVLALLKLLEACGYKLNGQTSKCSLLDRG
jgi:hypothetical protein